MKCLKVITLIWLLPSICPAATTPLLYNSEPVEISSSSLSPSRLTVTLTFTGEPVDAGLSDADTLTFTRWLLLPRNGAAHLNGLDCWTASGKKFTASYDPNLNEIVEIGRGFNLGTARLAPVTFRPIQTGINLSSDPLAKIVADISLTGGELSSIELPRNLRRCLDRFILNRDRPRRDQDGEASTTSYFYVFPDDDRVAELLEPLLQWRRLQGFNVVALRIPAGLTPDEQQDQALDNLRTHHARYFPVEYVCLVGDDGGEFAIPGFIRGTSDYPYGLFSGDDPIPEAAVGRLSFNSTAQLERIVNKILSYETEPDVQDLDWFHRGAVAAGNELSGFSTILVSRWARELMLDHGFASVDTLWWTMGGSVADFMRDSFDRGMTFISYRGWTGLEDWTTQRAERLDNSHLPVALLLGCNTGDYSGEGAGFTEALLRAEGGTIAAIGSSGAQTRVSCNNALMAGFYRGALEDSIVNIGWTLNRAKLELFAAYSAGQMDRVSDHAYWTNLMGDPGTVIWRGEPRAVESEMPAAVSIGDGTFEVRVASNDQPVAGARVGFYKENEIGSAAFTDSDGRARFTFEPLDVTAGNADISVSGDLVVPSSSQIAFEQPQRYLVYQNYSVLDDTIAPHQGNGNRVANPNEIVRLSVQLKNIGTDVIPNGVIFTLSSDAPVCEIIESEYLNEVNIQAGARTYARFIVGFTPDFPDREPIPFRIAAASGNDRWTINFSLEGKAPRWKVSRTSLRQPPAPGGLVQFNIFLKNTGSLNLARSTGTLESLTDYAQIIQENGDYDTLTIGAEDSSSGQPYMPYMVELDDNTPRGYLLPFILRLVSSDGYEGAAEFSIQVAAPGATNVTGPDGYGYYAINNYDLGTNIAPIYQWVGLAPEEDSLGTNTGLLDQGEDDDQSMVLTLPFSFRYYGVSYDRLTVCTNGWAAFGDQRQFVDFRNLPIGSPQGPRAQLCPWWDDLYQPGNEGNVYYWFDEFRHRFVVEWFQMRRWVGPGGPGARETFELILLDPQWHPSTTGDGDIIFQYSDVINEDWVDANGTPYATIGIGSPDDRSGLQIGYGNHWAIGVDTLIRSGDAIRFATAKEHRYCLIKGEVKNLTDSSIVADAVVQATPGGWSYSSADGSFRIPNALAERNLTLTASATGFNAVSIPVQPVGYRDSTSVILYLSHPEISVNPDEIVDTLSAVSQKRVPVTISNSGNGALTYSIGFAEAANVGHSPRPIAESRDELWGRKLTINVSEATGDYRIQGAICINGLFYVSGGSNAQDNKYFYIFDWTGRYLDRRFQPSQSLWGLHDLAWDGANIYGGSGDWIYRWNPANGQTDSIPSPLLPARGMAVDSSNGDIWIVNSEDPICRLNADGNLLETYRHRLNPYGLAWRPDDPDGCPLWVFSNDGASHLAVSKMHLPDGTFQPVTELQLQAEDRPGGCELSTNLNPHYWGFIAVIQNPDGDRVEVFDAGVNLSWLQIEPERGSLLPGQEQRCDLTMFTQGLYTGVYEVDMVIAHNAAGAELRIPILLDYTASAPGDPQTVPLAFALEPVFPNPSNNAVILKYSLSRPGNAELTLWDNQGRRVAELMNRELPAGSQQYRLTSRGLPSGIYYVRLTATEGTLTRKLVVLK